MKEIKNSCISCGCWDSDVEGCTMPSVDRSYACPLEDKPDYWARICEIQARQTAKVDPVLGSVMVRECVYRGFCPEFKPCGYTETDQYKKELEEYRKR